MSGQYVEKLEKVFRIKGTRVALDSVIYLFLEGRSPEAIQDAFPALSLSQVYGAIAYYLDHQAELDRVSCAKRSSTPPSENAGHGRPESQLDRTLCGHREGAHGGARAEPTQRNMTTRAPERKRRRVAAHSKRSLVRDCIPTNYLGRSDERTLKNIQEYIKV